MYVYVSYQNMTIRRCSNVGLSHDVDDQDDTQFLEEKKLG